MMTTPHLGEAGTHPVIASAASELLNKSENERSGVLSTAMSFLGLYRDPVVAKVTRALRLAHRAISFDDDRPTTLYLVVPPSDISRTKPLIRLILNQIGRRLTEDLDRPRSSRRHRLLLMLDEFPALGRLDFFESALAFMAGYGLKSFLIAQSLNQIEKAYGPNNAILDNCHVRVAFATNDERTAKRVSDALGTATEMRAHEELCRSPAQPLARPSDGLAPGDGAAAADARRGDAAAAAEEIVMLVPATPPIRAQEGALLRGPTVRRARPATAGADAIARAAAARRQRRLERPAAAAAAAAKCAVVPTGRAPASHDDDDVTDSERRHATGAAPRRGGRDIGADDGRLHLDKAPKDDALRARRMTHMMRGVAQQAALDPADNMNVRSHDPTREARQVRHNAIPARTPRSSASRSISTPR